MAATITYLGTLLNGADSSTNWTANASISVDTQSKTHGSGCLGIKQSTGINFFMYNHSGGVDFTTGDKHIYIWGLAASAAKLDTRAAAGIAIRLGSNNTSNYYEWYVDGSDTYPGGWKKFMVNPNAEPDGTNGTPPALSSITYLGLSYNCTSQFTGNNQTLFIDALHIGTGLQITGTSTTDAGFEDMWTDEQTSSSRYGVINKISGVYFVKGELIFGSTTSSTNPNFTDISSTVVFEDQRASDTLYKINIVGHASDTTNKFQLGTRISSDETSVGSKGAIIAATGSAATTGSFTYVSGSPATITRSAGNFKTDGLKGGWLLQITGTSSNNKNVVMSKVAATTITLLTGETLTNEGPVSSTLTGSRRWNFLAANANIKTFNIYGTTLKQAGTIGFGSSSTALAATTLELVDNTLSNARKVTRRITTASPLYLRNSINFNTNLRASLDLYDTTDTPSTRWSILEGTGFENTGTAGTRTISGHTFRNTSTNKPYASIQDSASSVWNINNANDGSGARPTIGSTKAELNFDGTASTNGTVNENYIVTWTTQTPAGGALNNVRVKIVESDDGAGNPALVNQGTSSGGSASSTYLRAKYVPNGASNITATTHVPAAFKSYLYGKLPFFTSTTINQPVSVTATHTPDVYQVQGTASTAISTGESGTVVSIIEAGAQQNSLIKFTGGSGGTLADNQTITASGGSPATGSVVGKIIEGDDTAGTILLDGRNASTYDNGETLSNGAGWSATYTNDSEQRFHWIIDAGLAESRSAQTVYDYIMAKLDEATADTDPPIDKLIIAGRAEFGTPFQGVATGPNTFKTTYNSALSRGWAIANLNNLGSITQFTDNAGTAFTPAATVSVTVTIINQAGVAQPGVEVAIFQDDTARTVVLASTSTDENGQVSTAVAASLGGIIIRTRQSTDIATFDTDTGVNFTTEVITTDANHDFRDGDSVVYKKNGGSLNVGLTEGTTYYVNNITATTLSLHTTAANAISDTSRVDLLDVASSETHQLDPIRFVAGSATGTVGTSNFSAQISLITDNIATG
jgi:hypothetical protein